MRLGFIVACLSLLVIGLNYTAPASAGESKIYSMKTRPGVEVSFRYFPTDGAPATIIYFVGGPGKADLRDNYEKFGFGSHARELFLSDDFNLVMVDAPSDQSDYNGGMHPVFRSTDEHTTDIDQVIKWVKAKSNLPIWLIGTSLGTRSVAHLAVNAAQSFDGMVLLSSSTNPPRGKSIVDFGLGKIKIPALMIGHKYDGCRGTPPSGAKEIAAALKSSPKAEVKIFTGGSEHSRNPCIPPSNHTFYGIENEVVSFITKFIKANLK
jgi:pimeloyl-ACP methyl ester carboxylesterase